MRRMNRGGCAEGDGYRRPEKVSSFRKGRCRIWWMRAVRETPTLSDSLSKLASPNAPTTAAMTSTVKKTERKPVQGLRSQYRQYLASQPNRGSSFIPSTFSVPPLFFVANLPTISSVPTASSSGIVSLSTPMPPRSPNAAGTEPPRA